MKKKLRFDNGMLIRHCRWVLVVMMVHLAEMAFSQSVTVTGRVVSKDDANPIPGVNVVIKNTSIGTTTDVEGNYALSAPEDATLVFSFIGFQTMEVPVNSRQVIDVSLAGDTQTLEEVVVTGYSTQRKKDITGSVSIVEVDNLKSVPATSAEQALQGMACGVNVTR